MSVYEELMKEEKQWEPDPRQTKAMRDYIRDVEAKMKKEKAEKAKAAEAKPETDVSHTEYEGSSLKEKVKYLAEIARLAGPGPATDVRRRPGTSEKGRRARRRSSGETHKTPLELHMLKMTHPDTGVNAGTEHEGPSLREKLEYLKRSM